MLITAIVGGGYWSKLVRKNKQDEDELDEYSLDIVKIIHEDARKVSYPLLQRKQLTLKPV